MSTKKNHENKIIKKYENKTVKNRNIKKSYLSKLIKKTVCKSNIKPFEREYEKINKTIDERNKNINDTLVKLLRKKTVPKGILPNNDFYTYINYEWIKYTKVDTQKEGYIVQLDDFRLVQNKVFYELIDIILNYIKQNKNELSKQISNVYQSGIKLLDDNQAKNHLNNYINFYNLNTKMRDNMGLWRFLGIMNKNDIISFGLPLVFGLNPDLKDSKIFRCTMNQPILSIIDIKVYFDDGTDVSYKKDYKKRFFNYIDQMFEKFFGKNNNFKAQHIFDVETQIINAMVCENGNNNEEKKEPYYRISGSESTKKYNLDWDAFTLNYGFKTPPDFFITYNPNYVRCISETLLNEWTTDKWRTYFIYIYMRQIIRFHKTWKSIPFEFCGKFMRGQEVDIPLEIYPVFPLSLMFNTFLTNEYIKKFADLQVIDYVKSLAEDLKVVYERKIRVNDWLQPQTKKYALQKLKYLKFEIGSQEELRSDPLLNYNNNDIFDNFLKIINWKKNQLVNLEGKQIIDIPTIEWNNFPFKLSGTQSYIVNAMYIPTKNAMYIPLGYLQKPFVDLAERGIEYNLARIGNTIGHELSHSLDNSGSKFDHLGNLKNWWKPEDSKIFEKKQDDVIKQYEYFYERDGIHDFDASLSVGEDLADISGLSICIEYLNDFQNKNEDIIPIKILAYKAFLVYYAVQSRQRINKKAITAQLRTNPHPLDKYRINIPLSRLKLFRDMYNVKKEDNMFWHNTDTIW